MRILRTLTLLAATILTAKSLQFNAQVNAFNQCSQFSCLLKNLNGTVTLHNDAFISSRTKSPECADILFQALISLNEAFKSLDMEYFIMFGTLLGAVQRGNVFDWTSDVDLAVDPKVFHRLLTDEQVSVTLERYNLHAFRGGERLIRVCLKVPTMKSTTIRTMSQYLDTHPYLDIYLSYDPHNATSIKRYANVNYVKINPSECVFSVDDIYPLKRCMLRDKFFPCPKRSHMILRKHYGNAYLKPSQVFSQPQLNAFGCT